MAALQKLTAVSPTLTPSLTVASRPQRDLQRSLRELLGGLLILAVWLFLWSWVTVGVLAPLGRTGAERTRAEAVEALRA